MVAGQALRSGSARRSRASLCSVVPMLERLTCRSAWLCALILGLLPASAAAEGAVAIAGAPVAAYGQQEFGNTTNGFSSPGECEDFALSQWWTLSVVAGDHITFDWEAQEADTHLSLYPVGTTDFNYPQVKAALSLGLNQNNKNEGTLDATKSGAMPLVFVSQSGGCGTRPRPGPYNFTVYVVHEVRLSVPRIRLHRQGYVAVGVHDPEGGPITAPTLTVSLELKVGRAWRTIGTGTASGGIARVSYSVRGSLRHRTTHMRAVAHGAGYAAATSLVAQVKTA